MCIAAYYHKLIQHLTVGEEQQMDQSRRDALKKQLSDRTITIDQYTERLVQNMVWALIIYFVFLYKSCFILTFVHSILCVKMHT